MNFFYILFQSAQVKLVLGHTASLRKKPTEKGHTHDWTFFLKGAKGEDISNFIKKIDFLLHDSFDKARRGMYDLTKLFVLITMSHDNFKASIIHNYK